MRFILSPPVFIYTACGNIKINFNINKVVSLKNMNNEEEPLHQIPEDKWSNLLEALASDLPRCIVGYNLLKIQRDWLQQGFDYGFKVYCPFGDVGNGMVALITHEKSAFYEIEICVECTRDDTKAIEEALKGTKVINWNKNIEIMFAAHHIVECIKRISNDVKVDIDILKRDLYIMDLRRPFDISLPPEVSFKLLSLAHAEVVDSKWPHRFPGSTKYFEALILNEFGYGLFKNEELVAWATIKEIGALGHVYTLEQHRKEGYGEMVVKLVCNVLLKKNLDVYSYVIEANDRARKFHEKIGFEVHGEVGTCHLTRL